MHQSAFTFKKTVTVIISLALTLAVLLSTLSLPAYAETTSGTCGPELRWDLDDNGVLTISGVGEMDDYNPDTMWDKTSIKEVSFETGVTSIGYMAFSGSENLVSIDISDSVTVIKDDAEGSVGYFSGCKSLTAINVSGGNENYSSEDGALFNKDKTTLLCVPSGKTGEYAIPNGVTTIAQGAFEGGITSVTIPKSVVRIGYLSVTGTNVADITVPGSATEIEIDSFVENHSLKNVTLGDGITVVPYEMFFNCDNLESITLPDSLRSIEQGAFDGCTSLKDVYFNGTEEEWNAVVIDDIDDTNIALKNARIHITVRNEGAADTGVEGLTLWIALFAAAVLVIVVVVITMNKSKK